MSRSLEAGKYSSRNSGQALSWLFWRIADYLSSYLGTLDNPIVVKSAGDEQYAGCTGHPADSHVTIWLAVRVPNFPLSPSYLPTFQPS